VPARKSVLSDWVPGEDEEAHAAATVASLSTSGYPVPVKPTLKDVLVPAPLQAAYSSPPRRPQASVRTPRSPRSSTRLLARKLRVDRTWVFASRDSLLQLFGQMVMVGLWLVAMWLLQAYWDDLAVPVREVPCLHCIGRTTARTDVACCFTDQCAVDKPGASAADPSCARLSHVSVFLLRGASTLHCAPSGSSPGTAWVCVCATTAHTRLCSEPHVMWYVSCALV